MTKIWFDFAAADGYTSKNERFTRRAWPAGTFTKHASTKEWWNRRAAHETETVRKISGMYMTKLSNPSLAVGVKEWYRTGLENIT